MILIGISYFLTKYLKVPRHGFTNQEKMNGAEEDSSQAESLLQAETLTNESISPDVFKPIVLIVLIAVAVYTYSRKEFGVEGNDSVGTPNAIHRRPRIFQ